MMELDFIFVLWKMQGDYNDLSCGELRIDPGCLVSKPDQASEALLMKMIICNFHKEDNIYNKPM